MSPKFWESKASQLYRYRWWLGGAAVFAFLGIGVSVLFGNRIFLVTSVAIGFPVIVIAWGLLCATSWFEPTRGTLRTNNWLGRNMPLLNTFARYWAAICLPLFIAAGLIGTVWWVLGVANAA